jgi:hypothetical protein
LLPSPTNGTTLHEKVSFTIMSVEMLTHALCDMLQIGEPGYVATKTMDLEAQFVVCGRRSLEQSSTLNKVTLRF